MQREAVSVVADKPEEGMPWPWERLRHGHWIGRLGVVAGLVLWAWILSSWPVTRAAALLVGTAGGVAIVLRPALALPLLALTVPFGSLRTVSLGPAAVGAEELLLGAITGVWLMRGLARRRLAWRWPALAGAGLALLAVMLVSFLPATSLALAAKELVKWLELWLAVMLVVNLLAPGDADLLVLGLLAGGTAEGLLGLYQFLTRRGPEGFLLMGRFMRAAGTFEQPNPYGGYLGLTIPLALGIVLCAWPAGGVRADRRAVLMWGAALAAGGLMLGGLVASWSRGAWLGAAAAVAAVTVVRGGAWLRAVLAVGVVGLALSLLLFGRVPVPGALQQRFSEFAADLTTLDVRNVEVTDANFAVVERAAHWQAALGMITDHPWTGVGIGNYAAAYDQYALPRWPDPLGHAHNYYLNIAAEAGLPGLAAYLLFVGAGLWLAFRAVRVSRGVQQGIALGALGMLVHLSVHNLFDNLYVHGMAIQVGLLLGLAAWVIAQNAGARASGAQVGR
jgi:putative inorganic carbon (HCO3(-)) transporter